VLEENSALEILPAMQTGSQHEVTLEQRAGLAEQFQ
jgi:hypothetical protein